MNKASDTPRDLELKIDKIQTSLPFTFRHRPAKKPEALAIFLHGYTDHSGSFLRRLFKDEWPETFDRVSVLAPNGPFPVPVKSDSGWREAYAWFFYDDRDKTMVVSPETAILGCLKLVDEFGYDDVPKIIVGFSQGGYLAPHLAARLKNVVEIIGVATGFNEESYAKGTPWTVSAVHGAQDEVFAVDRAREAHAKILAKGFSGAFYEVPNATHVASPEIGKILIDRIKTYL